MLVHTVNYLCLYLSIFMNIIFCPKVSYKAIIAIMQTFYHERIWKFKMMDVVIAIEHER